MDNKEKRIGVYVAYKNREVIHRLKQEAKKKNVKLEVINYDKVHILVAGRKKFSAFIKDNKYVLPPIILNRLHSTAPDISLLILSHFQRSKNTKIINRVNPTSIARDKFRTIQTLASKGFNVPATVLLGETRENDLKWAVKAVGGLPAILKLARGSLGVGVIMIESTSALRSIYDIVKNKNQPMILQQYLASEPGIDYRFYIIGYKVVAAMKRCARKKGEFRANISRGGKGEIYKSARQEIELAEKISRTIGLEICGIDFIRTANGFAPIEVNINPGLVIEKITGVNVAGKIIDYCIQQFVLFQRKLAAEKNNGQNHIRD